MFFVRSFCEYVYVCVCFNLPFETFYLGNVLKKIINVTDFITFVINTTPKFYSTAPCILKLKVPNTSASVYGLTT